MVASRRTVSSHVLILWCAFSTCWSLQGEFSSRKEQHLQAATVDGPVDDLDDDTIDKLLRSDRAPARAEGSASALAEAWVAQMREARANSFRTVVQILGSREHSEEVLTVEAICSRFRLDNDTCPRVGLYLGNVLDVKEKVKVRVRHFSPMPQVSISTVIRLRDFSCSDDSPGYEPWAIGVYRGDLCKALESAGSASAGGEGMIFFVGDGHDKICSPTLIKTRYVHKLQYDMSVLLPLNRERHWGMVAAVPASDRDLDQKADKLIWRGVSTGICNKSEPGSRMMLVGKHFNSVDTRIDVGMTAVVQGCDDADAYMRGEMTMKEHLANKYILVVDGNDKASGLNWILSSNSLPFMIEPKYESWLMESVLEPWVHYMPVKEDFSDLSEKLDWAHAHPVEVNHMVNAGKHHVELFRDAATEANVEGAVFAAYMNRVDISEDAVAGDDDIHKC